MRIWINFEHADLCVNIKQEVILILILNISSHIYKWLLLRISFINLDKIIGKLCES